MSDSESIKTMNIWKLFLSRKPNKFTGPKLKAKKIYKSKLIKNNLHILESEFP